MITLKLSQKELNDLVQALDAGVRAHGLARVKDIANLVAKIEEAANAAAMVAREKENGAVHDHEDIVS